MPRQKNTDRMGADDLEAAIYACDDEMAAVREKKLAYRRALDQRLSDARGGGEGGDVAVEVGTPHVGAAAIRPGG